MKAIKKEPSNLKIKKVKRLINENISCALTAKSTIKATNTAISSTVSAGEDSSRLKLASEKISFQIL